MDRSQIKAKKLRRRQLDALNNHIRSEKYLTPISGTWLQEVRQVLGLSLTQLSRRLGISAPNLKKLELSEAKQTIELKTLQKVAAAMDCRVIYAIVPQQNFASFEAILEERAKAVATALMGKISQTMSLEAQGVGATETQLQIKDLAEELLQNLDKRLWDLE